MAQGTERFNDGAGLLPKMSNVANVPFKVAQAVRVECTGPFGHDIGLQRGSKTSHVADVLLNVALAVLGGDLHLVQDLGLEGLVCFRRPVHGIIVRMLGHIPAHQTWHSLSLAVKPYMRALFPLDFQNSELLSPISW